MQKRNGYTLGSVANKLCVVEWKSILPVGKPRMTILPTKFLIQFGISIHTNTHCTLPTEYSIPSIWAFLRWAQLCNPHPLAAGAELIKIECYGNLPVHSNIPVCTELPHDNLWLNGIKMTVKGLEFHSEVLQQSFPALSVSAVRPGFDIVCVVSALICTEPVRFPRNEMSLVSQTRLINHILSRCVCVCVCSFMDMRHHRCRPRFLGDFFLFPAVSISNSSPEWQSLR